MSLLKDAYKTKEPVVSYSMETIANIDFALNKNCNNAGKNICTWCPNDQINYASDEVVLSDDDLRKILTNLKDAGYTGKFSLNRYNEPFLNPRLAEQIGIFYEVMPNTKVSCNTNSTLITPENLEATCKAGMTSYRMQIYPTTQDQKEDFNIDWVSAKVKKLSDKLGLDVDFTYANMAANVPGYYYEYKTSIKYGGKKSEVRIYAKNLTQLGCDRGGLVSGLSSLETRQEPCVQIGRFLGIDANGDVVPCTNYTGRMLGYKSHMSGVVGNLLKEPAKEILNRIIPMANDLTHNFSQENLAKYSGCKHCNFEPHAGQMNKLIESMNVNTRG